MSEKTWVNLATAGVVLVVVPLILFVLVMADKKHFGWMVGTPFLGGTLGSVLLGGLVLLVAAWKLPARKTWRGILLMVWALIAVTSPAFGIMFLLPWGVLALLLPVVIVALVGVRRRAVA